MTTFHINHNLTPDLTLELLQLAQRFPGSTRQKLLAQAPGSSALSQRSDGTKLIKSLLDLGLLGESQRQLYLSEAGRVVQVMATWYPHLIVDFVHFLYYTGYDVNPTRRFSWAYRVICDYLMAQAPCSIDADYLVDRVITEAANTFDIQGISFSAASVRGVKNWLAALNPRVYADKLFTPRKECSPELFALTLAHMHTQDPDATRVTIGEQHWLLVNRQTENRIARLCLLDVAYFDEMLAATRDFFPEHIMLGQERGTFTRRIWTDFSWQNILVEDD